MSDLSSDLDQYILRPSQAEVRDTRVLYHAWDPSNPGYETDELPKLASLEQLGLNVTIVTGVEPLLQKLDYDYVFVSQAEGVFPGHETLIPSLMAFRGTPCLGANGPGRAISEDKVLGKALAASLGVGVARHRVIDPREPGVANLFPPGRWILKPRRGVMSEHVSYIDDASSWRKAVTRAAHPMHGGEDFIAEEFVPGLNVAVPVVEGLPPGALPVFLEGGEARHNILTKEGKQGLTADYANGAYDGPGAAEARVAGAKLAAAIAPFDYARFDFRFEPVSNRLVFLEVNMNCALGPGGVVAQAAALRGIDHPTLIGHIFTHSLRRQRKAS